MGLGTAALGLFTPHVRPGRHFNSVSLVAPWEEGGRGKYAGKPIVIFGGASSVGQYSTSSLNFGTYRVVITLRSAIQLAKLSGFSPIITTASLHNTELLRSLGATHVVDRKLSTEQLRDEFSKITTEPLDLIYDAISLPDTQLPAYELLAQGGTLALVSPPAIPAEKVVAGKRFFPVFGESMFPEENRVATARLYSKLTTWLKEGLVKVRYDSTAIQYN